MARIALILAIIGGLAIIFTNYAIVLVFIALILSIIDLIIHPKSFNWVLPFLLSIFYILLPLWFYLKIQGFSYYNPNYTKLLSAKDYYFGPTYNQRKSNFNFDSLMLSPQQVKDLKYSSTDTGFGPGEAPIE